MLKSPRSPGSHAVVLGSGMAGLAAAGVLAPCFEQVTVIEHDPAPGEREARKGVPQGRHVHILLKAGENGLGEIFPGLAADLEANGSCRVDFGHDFGWFHHGVWKARHESGITLHMQSRPLLESIVRRRVEGLGNVAFSYGTAAQGIEISNGRATAVRIQSADAEETLAGDLIVDASGRGSQLPRWLEAGGYPAPREERIGLDLVYATRIFRAWPDPERPWKALLLYQTPPVEKRVGAIFPIEAGPIEDGRWMVTLAGFAGDHPPGDGAGFLDFARSLAQPTLYDAIRDPGKAEPLSDIETFHFPYARWRHFEELKRFPAGLIPLGDTVCSFDPVFGQGMSVAAQGAVALAAHLDRDPEVTDGRPFSRVLSRRVGVPWLLTSSEDLRYPQVEGRRPLWLPVLQAYTRRVFRLTGSSVFANRRFVRLINLLTGPEILFHPGIVAGVLRKGMER